jgi:hypothetical protein
MTVMTMNYRGSLKGVAALFLEMRDHAMGGIMGSTSSTKSDAGVKLGVPTSSRTSLPARIEIAVPPGREELIFIHTPHPRSDRQDLGERQCSPRMRRLRW